ncbi:hypothetical protein NP493_2264g00002 [Ridgeia piscesae]|uniref:Uncharacterized protein n=1 Tax=Ridgeia piscesae TaxID=27915 RepID=A0AAD9JJS9_RIDPI|nr:hypothetical protein NP493_2264g00002 [Ridgeia piscesae]
MSFTSEDADDVDDYNSAAATNDLDEEDTRHRKHTYVSSSERHQRRNNSRSRLCPRCSNDARMSYYGDEAMTRRCSIASSQLSLPMPPLYWARPSDISDTRPRYRCGSPCYVYVLLLINLMTVSCISARSEWNKGIVSET